MGKKELYIITRDKTDDNYKTIGFIKDFGQHLYYEFVPHKVQLKTKKEGSHFSYHEDGSLWRTSQGVGKEKIMSTVPFKKFNTYFDLCAFGLDRNFIKDLKAFKEKYRGKAIIIELDFEQYESDFINFFVDMVHVDFHKQFMQHPEAQYPANAHVIQRKINKDIIITVTVLGQNDNLLLIQKEDGFEVRHFNKRFSANSLGSTYMFESSDKI